MESGSECTPLELTVNGQVQRLAVDSRTPLLYVLRDECGLSSPKFGCGKGICGACTVHVDGRAMQSCETPLSAAEGRSVTTLEGLAPAAGALHSVQAAFARHGAIQCGYCIAGVMMTLVALKARQPHCTPEQLGAELAERHLCRCGTHARILAAAQEFLAAP
ncbi:(2Fe-2S)-binding protein [Variovorax paradoxus]|nr:(2Fe-2S)-binding protein [Variovorax paradoxus]MBT2305194.1 (2Fe-2S)-binding protein [Variovorax paradoxus]